MKTIVDLVALAWMGWIVYGIVLCLRRRRRAGAVVLAIAAAAMLCELLALPMRLLASLERPWLGAADLPPGGGEAVVYLGGAISAPGQGPFGFDLNESADRVLTAVELARRTPPRPLVLGGGEWGEPPEPLTAQLFAGWVERWKLCPGPVIALPPSVNTHDEARHAAELARERGWKSVCLVTSAWHMRRARATFEKAGLQVIPAPCDFKATTWLKTSRGPHLFPSTDSVMAVNLWAREVIGYFTYRIRGWA